MMNKILREVKPNTTKLVDDDGLFHLGTFEDYFKDFNLLNFKRPFFKKTINKMLLTEWQALEVLGDEIFMICAVFKFNAMNRSLLMVYEIKENILHDYSSQSLFRSKAKVSPTLIDSSVSSRVNEHSSIKLTNNLENNKLSVKGYASGEKGVEFDIDFTRIAKPSIISLPMTNKHTVYTEKDLLVPKGYIKLGSKKYDLNDSHITVFDDHRGFYPMNSGYDWITCMGDIEYKNEYSKFGVNLTYFYKNDEPNKYNENGYWLNGEFFQLPSVTFERQNGIWLIKDKEGRVNLEFTNRNQYKEDKKLILVIDYTLAFGELSGTIKTYDNETIKINKMFSLGEKRLTRMLR